MAGPLYNNRIPIDRNHHANKSAKVQSLGAIVNIQSQLLIPHHVEAIMDHPVCFEMVLTLWL